MSAASSFLKNKCHAERSGPLRCQRKEIKESCTQKKTQLLYSVTLNSHYVPGYKDVLKIGLDYVLKIQLSSLFIFWAFFFFYIRIQRKEQIWSAKLKTYSTSYSKHELKPTVTDWWQHVSLQLPVTPCQLIRRHKNISVSVFSIKMITQTRIIRRYSSADGIKTDYSSFRRIKSHQNNLKEFIVTDLSSNNCSWVCEREIYSVRVQI